MQNAPQPAAAHEARRPTIRGTFQETLIKLMIIYFITTYAFRRGGVVLPATPGAPGASSSPIVTASGTFVCSVAAREALQLRVWLSESPTHALNTSDRPLLHHQGLIYDGSIDALERTFCLVSTEGEAVAPTSRCEKGSTVVVLPAVKDLLLTNRTVFMHAYLETVLQPVRVAQLHAKLNRFMPPPQPEKFKNLLESSAEQRAEVDRIRREHEKLPWISYWKDNVTLAFVVDLPPFDLSKTPATILSQLQLSENDRTYAPVFYVNDFWTYKEHFYEANATSLVQVPLRLSLSPMGMWKWQLYSQMEQSFATQQEWGMASEMDDMKRVLSDTNPWLLGVTVVVSMVHMIFDFLAFKNDITFWKSRKSLEGLSVRSILISFGCQLIIFLYLADSETSWMILLSAGISVAIEGWKITKTNDVTFSSKFPFINLADKNSYKSKTKEFDEQAMYYLSFVVYPLVVVYAVYSLWFDTHKSYYSWFIGSLSGAVYMFGFLQMTPQLFINYKLKSVAHLPWRVFVYKALNTFIDDMFAFIIKMPTMHRLSVFRDDIIFFIFLYQRWIYRVDKVGESTRVNEFGQSFEDANHAAVAAEAEVVTRDPKNLKIFSSGEVLVVSVEMNKSLEWSLVAAPRRGSFSKLNDEQKLPSPSMPLKPILPSKQESFVDSAAPLNVSYELHRMHGTPRAAKFLEFVTTKLSPEPFLCWSALERLIGEVRDNTLTSHESRAAAVKGIVEEFIVDGAKNQIGLIQEVRDKVEELHRNLSKSAEFWDGRPLLMLQREVEIMLLSDVREFGEKNPSKEEDLSVLDDGLVEEVLVSTQHVDKAPVAESKKTELLRKLSSLKVSDKPTKPTSALKGLLGSRRRTLTMKRGLGDGIEEDCLINENRTCQLTRTSLLVHRVPSGDASPAAMRHSSETNSGSPNLSSAPQYDIKLQSGLKVTAHSDLALVEISGDPVSRMTFFLGFEDAERCKVWANGITLRMATLRESAEQVKAKRARILAMPTGDGQTMRMLSLSLSAGRRNTLSKSSPKLSPPVSPARRGASRVSSPISGSPPDKVTTKDEGNEWSSEKKRSKSPPALADGYRMMPSMSDMTVAMGYNAPANSQEQALQQKYGASASPLNTGYGMSVLDFGVQAEAAAAAAAAARSDDSDESSSESDGEEGGGRDDFNEVFQRCVTELRNLEDARSVSGENAELEKKRMETYVELIGMAEDFVASAVRYGQIIVSEVYLPVSRKTIKPDKTVGGVIGGEKYIVQNILFKFALDSHGVFGGNDESAAKVAGLELKGLQAYMSSNTPDLCYPLQALIDYS